MSRPPKGAPKTAGAKGLLRIGRVSELAGVHVETIRAWERRYGAVEPERTPGGERRYTMAHVHRLKLLSTLTDSGWSIGDIASLPDEELDRLLPSEPAPDPIDQAQRFVDAIEQFDVRKAEGMLARAAAVLPPDVLAEELTGPILAEVGRRWELGTYRVAHEHIATAVVRGVLWRTSRPQSSTDAPLFVGTTLPGERHDTGLLMAALVAAASGYRTFILEREMPPEEVAFAARGLGASVLALSLVNARPDRQDALNTLMRAVDPTLDVVIGGRSSSDLDIGRAKRFDRLGGLARWLSRR